MTASQKDPEREHRPGRGFLISPLKEGESGGEKAEEETLGSKGPGHAAADTRRSAPLAGEHSCGEPGRKHCPQTD
ncbi:hypothetical protein CesoFtcFv8_025118 [Champsocephalus esox]|uniref:Uncharacterized protein n=1 Tax=Champsocephalus esox TaxID=159716 RepID=A0AAN8B385_9TELE|nr:hypothetical protein CesoFtcFv8_025118 [Champsocephalus esox]